MEFNMKLFFLCYRAEFILDMDKFMTLHYDGKVQWNTPAKLDVGCNLQNNNTWLCPLVFASWAYDSKLDLQTNVTSGMDRDHYRPTHQLELIYYHGRRIEAEQRPHLSMVYELHFRERYRPKKGGRKGHKHHGP